MAVRERLSGNEAVAYAVKQINPDVMPAFPITPSTEIPQYVANYIANGEIDKKKLVRAEPLRNLGTFTVPIKLHTQVTAELKVRIDGV